MKLSLEKHFPYALLALIVLAVFYGIYFGKCWRRSSVAFKPARSGAGKKKKYIPWKRS